MFSGLRQNSLFYVLDKNDTPKLRIGQVVSVSNEQMKYPNTFVPGQYNPQPMETTVDVKVKFDDEELEFKRLPSKDVIANEKGVVVSDNKEAMNAEVEGMLMQSRAILESIDYHKNVVSSCEGMLSQLNPQIAKEKAQAERISSLEGKVSGIEGKLDKVIGLLSKNA